MLEQQQPMVSEDKMSIRWRRERSIVIIILGGEEVDKIWQR